MSRSPSHNSDNASGYHTGHASPSQTPSSAGNYSESSSSPSDSSRSTSVVPESPPPPTPPPTGPYQRHVAQSTVPTVPAGHHSLRDPYMGGSTPSIIHRYSFDAYIEEQERARRVARGEGTSGVVAGVPVDPSGGYGGYGGRRDLPSTVDYWRGRLHHLEIAYAEATGDCERAGRYAEIAVNFAARERMMRQKLVWISGVLAAVVVLLVAVLLHLLLP